MGSEVGGGIATSVPSTYPTVKAMAVYDDGREPALYVGGAFSSAGGERANRLARWDGSGWEPVGGGLDGTVEALCVFDEDGPDPHQPALFVGGQFSTAGGGQTQVIRIARWDGSEWTPVGGWSNAGSVLTMTVWDQDGPGPLKESLYIGGFFTRLPDGTLCNQLARW